MQIEAIEKTDLLVTPVAVQQVAPGIGLSMIW
jgi:hypothetical protein